MLPSITTIYGEPGTIKSSLAITWPGSIAFYNLEGGARRAWGYDALVDAGTIVERSFTLATRSIIERWAPLKGYRESWQIITGQLEADFQKFSTVVWDTGTVMWAVCRDAYLQELQETSKGTPQKQLLQIQYGDPNRRMTGLFNINQAFQKNLVVVHHETDEYMDAVDPAGKPILDEYGNKISYTTGNKVPEGFKATRAISDWVLRTTFKDTPEGQVPIATIEKSGYGLHLRGKEIEWPTYAKLEALVNPPSELHTGRIQDMI
jgi:hypothetical protein